MKKRAEGRRELEALRIRVEERLKQVDVGEAGQPPAFDSLRLLHELQVHQVELELQNEELMCTRSELESSLRRYAELFHSAPAAYVSLDRSGGIVKGNKAAELLLGFQEGIRSRHDFGACIASGERAAFDQFLSHVFASSSPASIDLELSGAEGRHVYAHLDACRQVSDDECLVMIADLSALREATLERERLQLQLWQVQKMETIGRLAGGIAHDLNNLHCASLLQLNLLEHAGHMNDEALQIVGDLKGLSQRSSTLTQQLLLFSRKSPMKLMPADLNRLIQGMLQMLRRIIGENYELVFEPVECVLPTSVDESRIQQVLMNLVVNARDAMPSGGRLSIITRALDYSGETVPGGAAPRKRGAYACLEVRDEGSGISPEHLRYIFDPFFTTKEVGRGTGLGLSIVDGIVSQHGGWVEVHSKEGEGSVFTVYLPRLDDATLVSTAEAAESQPVAGKGETILLVEDEDLLRAAAVSSLSRLGYRLLEARTAAEAIQLWEQQGAQVQLLVTDVSMPGGVSGLDLARRLMRTRPDLPVLLASGYCPEFLGLDQEARPGILLLQKPFTIEQLTESIRQALVRA